MAQMIKKPPAMRETWVLFLGWEDPLEKGKATPEFWPASSPLVLEGNGSILVIGILSALFHLNLVIGK